MPDTPNLNCISTASRSERTINPTDGTASAPSLPLERSFVSRLPPELLAIIFLEYAQSYRDDLDDFVYGTEVPHWVAVSYVCRHWRNVALDCAHLWAHLFFVSSMWMDELLRRSKTVPLMVYIDLSLFFDPAFPDPGTGTVRSLEKALEHMERIQVLRIDSPPEDGFIDILDSRLTANAPLQSLYLSFQYTPFTITKDTFSRVIPSLREVYLKLCIVDWSSSIFNGLTELTLSEIVGDSGNNWDGLMLILRQLPHLRILGLDEVLETAVDISAIDPENIDKPISLPRLEKLTLTESIPTVSALLAQLGFPRSTIVQFRCQCDDRQVTSRLLPLIMGRFDRHQSLLQVAASAQVPFQYLFFSPDSISWTVEHGILSSHTNVHGTDIFSSIEKHLGSKIVSTHTSAEFDQHEILRWFRIFPLAHLKVIALQGFKANFDDEHLWEEVFRDTPELQIIWVEFGNIENLIRALHSHNGVIPVPTLIDIGFGRINFKKGKCLERKHINRRGCLVCLHSALASRAEAGIALQKLDFGYSTGITKEDVAEFSKVVGQLSLSGRLEEVESENECVP